MKQLNKKAFNIAELLVAIVIIGLISSAAFIAISPGKSATRDIRRRNDLRALYDTLEIYWADNRKYPTWTAGGCLEKEEATDNPFKSGLGFIPNYMPRIPKDPLYGRGYCYYYKTLPDGQNYHLLTKLETNPSLMKEDGGKIDEFYEIFASGGTALDAIGVDPLKTETDMKAP